MLDEQRRDRQLVERSLMDILGDTFAIYWRRFRKLIALVAIIQVPIAVLELSLRLMAPDSDWAFLSVGVIDGMASMLVYGAVIFAVGQHYLVDDISVERCYVRVMWRISSAAIPTVILGTLFAILMWQAINIPEASEISATPETEAIISILIGTGIVIAVLVVILIYAIYLVVIMPAIIVEGYRAQGAFRRSSQLLRDTKMRVLGHLFVYSFVAIGLFFVLSIPSFVLGEATVSEEAQAFSTSAVGIVLNRIVSVLIAPVTFIATTLLYYDIRIRKENYDIPRLSQEMGITRA